MLQERCLEEPENDGDEEFESRHQVRCGQCEHVHPGAAHAKVGFGGWMEDEPWRRTSPYYEMLPASICSVDLSGFTTGGITERGDASRAGHARANLQLHIRREAGSLAAWSMMKTSGCRGISRWRHQCSPTEREMRTAKHTHPHLCHWPSTNQISRAAAHVHGSHSDVSTIRIHLTDAAVVSPPLSLITRHMHGPAEARQQLSPQPRAVLQAEPRADAMHVDDRLASRQREVKWIRT